MLIIWPTYNFFQHLAITHNRLWSHTGRSIQNLSFIRHYIQQQLYYHTTPLATIIVTVPPPSPCWGIVAVAFASEVSVVDLCFHTLGSGENEAKKKECGTYLWWQAHHVCLCDLRTVSRIQSLKEWWEGKTRGEVHTCVGERRALSTQMGAVEGCFHVGGACSGVWVVFSSRGSDEKEKKR